MTVLKAAVLGYVAGTLLGTLAAWAAWAAGSHEHRYRITGRCPA